MSEGDERSERGVREDEMSERSERCEREWDRVSEEDERSETADWGDGEGHSERVENDHVHSPSRKYLLK